MDRKIAFIGCGNIASAMIKGIIQQDSKKAPLIMASDKNQTRLKSIADKTNIHTTTDNTEAASWGDIIFLCVEPKLSAVVSEQIKDKIQKSAVIVSVAAGVSVQELSTHFNQNAKIVRIMPNIPITVGEGMSMICKTDLLSENEMDEIVSIAASFGKTAVMDEEYINAFTACASSSPAMIFVLIEAMADAAVSMGIHRKDAYQIVSQAVLGGAKMVQESQLQPGVLKDKVCSPGGATIDMIASLEETGFRHSIIEALKKAEQKCDSINQK